MLKYSAVGLFWIGAALTTSAAESLRHEFNSHDVSLHRRQSTSRCPADYTSKNGLGFATYCNSNNPFADAYGPFKSPNMESCMDSCSRFWGDNEGCFGVVWREDGNCWLRNSTTAHTMTVSEGVHVAFANSTQMTALDVTCPSTDLSKHVLGNGITYEVHCGKTINGSDTCWSGYSSCEESPFVGFYHATSLEDCLQKCVKEHPLCRAVTYNPGLAVGYANCWPKTGFSDATLVDAAGTANSNTTHHSAIITQFEGLDTTCPSESKITVPDGRAYEVHCGKLNIGGNMTNLHTQNLTACIDACAANSKQGCLSALFDSAMQGGFSNCYLQNSTGVILNQTQATYALFSAAPIATRNSSKAWITGPVIVIIVLIVFGMGILWWRRRRSIIRKQGVGSAVEKDGDILLPTGELTGKEHPKELPAGPLASEMLGDTVLGELEGDNANEMPAGRTSSIGHGHTAGQLRELPA
ncbi:hypothetical protein ACN47E_003486 [Coniothyrium glycines]